MARALQDNKGYNEQEIVAERPDGSRRIALAHANPFYDESGKLVGAVNILVDVTERREAAHQLRAIVAATPECIKVIAPDGTLLDMNPAGLVMVDADDIEQVRGRSVYDLIAEEHREAFRAFHEQVCRGERGTLEFEIVGLRGTRRWMETHAVPLRGPDGGIRQLAITRDVTERRRAADELRRQSEALKEADRRKTEFLAMLAHELRNPLAPIRNGLQVMKLASQNGAVVEQARTMMERQLGHMVRLIDDLLDLSRITNGKVELRRERIDLAVAVQDAVDASRPVIDERGHELTVTLSPQPVYVDADRTRLAQVFANLLNNSAKYTDKGGHIWLAVERQGSDVVVKVRDNGSGIPADVLPRIFEMFTQADRTLERSQGGLGVGLCLVRGLVEMHGGRVEAHSDGPGQGSEFVVRLPVVLSPARGPQEGEGHGTGCACAAKCRVLIVDDNEDSANSLALMLQIMGYQTRTAHDGLAAVEAAASFRPAVVLLDIGLPKLSGYEACRRIREQPGGAGMVLIAQTGWGQEEDKCRAKEAGFNFHMVKPVDPAALEKLLAGLLLTPA